MNGKITFVSYSRIQNGISISGVAAINIKSVIIFNLNLLNNKYVLEIKLINTYTKFQ